MSDSRVSGAHPVANQLVPPFAASLLREPVLVTGSNGYFASWLVRALCDVGFEKVFAGDLTIPLLAIHPKAKSIVLDVTSCASIEAALTCGARTVFHCAALVPFNLSRRYSPADLRRVNIEGTEHVLRACRAAGVRRLICASSTGVSFRGADIAGSDEDSASPPKDLNDANDDYSASKAAAEALVLAGWY